MASEASWANTSDRSGRTANGRKAADKRFERLVDPDGTLDPKVRALRAAHARKAFLLGMSYKAQRARRAKRAETKE